MRYFQLAHQVDASGRPVPHVTYLGLPHDSNGSTLNPSDFCSGRGFAGTEKVRLPIELDGPPTDFIFAAFEIMVVHNRVVRALDRLCPGEFDKVPVATGFNDGDYFIIDTVTVIPCLDKVRSVFVRENEDAPVPRQRGPIALMLELVVKPEAIGGRHLIRPSEWDVVVVASERVKSLLESLKVRGVEYWPATRD